MLAAYNPGSDGLGAGATKCHNRKYKLPVVHPSLLVPLSSGYTSLIKLRPVRITAIDSPIRRYLASFNNANLNVQGSKLHDDKEPAR